MAKKGCIKRALSLPESAVPRQSGDDPRHSLEVRFALDSPLEGNGYELLVPRREARDLKREAQMREAEMVCSGGSPMVVSVIADAVVTQSWTAAR
jgi:hypothetical protein